MTPRPDARCQKMLWARHNGGWVWRNCRRRAVDGHRCRQHGGAAPETAPRDDAPASDVKEARR
jgi:hypothetical protein